MPIGERIRQLRKEHGWSQAELGQKIGTDAGRISRYEGGRITPSLDAAIRLAQVFDVSVDHLVIGGAPRHPLQGPQLGDGERLSDLADLNPDDHDAVLRIIDGLLTKNRVTAALDKQAS